VQVLNLYLLITILSDTPYMMEGPEQRGEGSAKAQYRRKQHAVFLFTFFKFES